MLKLSYHSGTVIANLAELFNVENVLFVLVIERLLVWKLWNGMKKITKCAVHVLSLELMRNCDSNLDTLEC